MIAVPSAMRGRSSNRPAGLDLQLRPVRRVVELRGADRAGAVDGVEVEGRRAAVRRSLSATIGLPSGEATSKVMSWSMNWPMKVVPGGVRRVVRVVRRQRRVGDQLHRPAVERVARVEDAPGRAELDERASEPVASGVGERRQPLEHPPEVRRERGSDVPRRSRRRGGCVRLCRAEGAAGADATAPTPSVPRKRRRL